jgi:hypothetical protein
MIKTNDGSATTTGEDNIYAKSLLNLGRMHYKRGEFDLSYRNLKQFVNKAKSSENKELQDIGRVNIGMINGTQQMKNYIELIKISNFNDFLKMKLKYFSDANSSN